MRDEVVKARDVGPLPRDRRRNAEKHDHDHRKLRQTAIGARWTRFGVMVFRLPHARRLRPGEIRRRRPIFRQIGGPLERMRVQRLIVEHFGVALIKARLHPVMQRREFILVFRELSRRSCAIGVAGVARRLCRSGRRGAEIIDLIDDVAEAPETLTRDGRGAGVQQPGAGAAGSCRRRRRRLVGLDIAFHSQRRRIRLRRRGARKFGTRRGPMARRQDSAARAAVQVAPSREPAAWAAPRAAAAPRVPRAPYVRFRPRLCGWRLQGPAARA